MNSPLQEERSFERDEIDKIDEEEDEGGLLVKKCDTCGHRPCTCDEEYDSWKDDQMMDDREEIS